MGGGGGEELRLLFNNFARVCGTGKLAEICQVFCSPILGVQHNVPVDNRSYIGTPRNDLLVPCPMKHYDVSRVTGLYTEP